MKFLFLITVVLFSGSTVWAEESLSGRWAYFMKIYQGKEMREPADAALHLRYEFTEGGDSRLYWWNEAQGDHCERRGNYKLNEGMLIDEVKWVNPDNSLDCGFDPDMDNGKVSRTPVSFKDGNMVMRLQFGEDEIFYVWKRTNEGDL